MASVVATRLAGRRRPWGSPKFPESLHGWLFLPPKIWAVSYRPSNSSLMRADSRMTVAAVLPAVLPPHHAVDWVTSLMIKAPRMRVDGIISFCNLTTLSTSCCLRPITRLRPYLQSINWRAGVFIHFHYQQPILEAPPSTVYTHRLHHGRVTVRPSARLYSALCD